MAAYKPPTGGTTGGDMLGSGELGNLSFGEQLGGGSGAGFGGPSVIDKSSSLFQPLPKFSPIMKKYKKNK